MAVAVQKEQNSLPFQQRVLFEWYNFHKKLIIVFWLLGLGALLLAWVFIAWQPISGRLPRYCSHLDMKMSVTGQDNDIVILGDSTALVGVNPLVVEQNIHAKVFNLAICAGEHPDGWYNDFHHYLKQNKPPKVVVIAFSGPSTVPFHVKQFESIYTKWRYFSFEVFCKFWHEYNPFHIFSIILTECMHLYSEARQDIDYPSMHRHKGYVFGMHGNLSPTPLTDQYWNTWTSHSVTIPALESSFAKIVYLKKVLEDRGIKVLLYLMPCYEKDEAIPALRRFYRGKVDNPFLTMPAHCFVDQTHPHPQGAILNSKMLAEFLKKHDF